MLKKKKGVKKEAEKKNCSKKEVILKKGAMRIKRGESLEDSEPHSWQGIICPEPGTGRDPSAALSDVESVEGGLLGRPS